MKFLKYTLIVLFSVGIMSCGSSGGDDPDTEPPVITITAPTVNQLFAQEETVNVKFSASDNVGLKSYVVSVNLVEVAVASLKTAPVDFVFDGSGQLSEKYQDVTFDMVLPLNATKGKYKIEIKVTDNKTPTANEKTESVNFIIE